jgi:nicotinate-nucleotide adenylyltransferase
MNQKQRIGISGGTFDPIHLGHLILAEGIREAFQLDKVLFIPSGKPPHKEASEVTDPEHRYAMVGEAVTSNPCFAGSRLELDRYGYTYTIDTLRQLKETYGSETELFFMTGADVVWDLTTWKSIAEVFELCEFVTALRPGYDRQAFHRQVDFLKATHGARIHTVEIPLIGVSSTDIRMRVRNGNSIKYLVPEGVERYIMSKGLYR